VSVIKTARPKTKLGCHGMSEIELALAKPVGVSRKFCLLDVAVLSPRLPTENVATTHVGWVA
jgi:hypothetical protein